MGGFGGGGSGFSPSQNIIPGSTKWGTDLTDVHQITGSLDITGSTIITSNSTAEAEIGSAHLGDWPAVTNYAFFGNNALDHSSAGNYAILQSAAGETIVNATSGQQLSFRLGNATKAAFATDGKFGIGVGVTPTAMLHVSNSSGVDAFRIDTQAATENPAIFVDGANSYVGIGTAVPSQKIHVSGPGPSALFLEADTDNANEDDTSYIKMSQDGGASNAIMGLCPNSASKDPAGNAYTGTIGSSFLFGSSTSLQLGAAGDVKVTIKQAGNVGIGTTNPTELLDIASDSIRIRNSQTPASAAATGTAGQIAWDANYVYVCVATDTWKRTSLSTW